MAVVMPVLAGLGAEADPDAWVAWGDDPAQRFAMLVPTIGGVIVCNVRTNVSGEGPRASAKLVRWSRAQLGELAVETEGSHRMASFQVEGQVIRGADTVADDVTTFALTLIAGVDGRTMPQPKAGAAKRGARSGTAGSKKAPASVAKAPAARRPASGASPVAPSTRARRSTGGA